MYPVERQFYGPVLLEKPGEIDAARKLHGPLKEYMLPVWVALPLKDGESFLEPTALVRREVGAVKTAWGANVCCWDPSHLKMADDPGRDAALLRFTLGKFVEYGCRVIPVASLREAYPRLSVMAEHAKRHDTGLCLRLKLDDVEEVELLQAVLLNANLRSDDCILLLDFGNLTITQHDDFAQAMIGWIEILRAHGNWRKVIVSGTSYPRKNPAPDNGEAFVERDEWLIWEWALKADPEFGKSATFGDFGADCAPTDLSGGGIPIPHIRYTLPTKTRVVRGTDGASMRGVMQRVSSAETFMGRSFSAGDEAIDDCGSGVTENCGSSSYWRFANMNHHFTLVLNALAQLYGISLGGRTAHSARQDSFEFEG
jgi:hypothetical protein